MRLLYRFLREDIGMMSIFDKSRHDPKFKKEAGENGILPIELMNKNGLRSFERRFILKKLLKCRRFFKKYLKENGEHTPFNTSYSWVNGMGNYTLSFTHFVPTNQKYAKQVLKHIDDAKVNSINCDLLLTKEDPHEDKLDTLDMRSNAAYVRVNTKEEGKLFYVNKGRKICHELKINKEQLELFDKCMDPSYTDTRQLDDNELKTIQSIVNHDHQKDESFAVFTALKHIKNIHTKMSDRRIRGRVRRGVEQTLTEFQLPTESKQFEEEKEKIELIFAYRFDINLNVRIHYSP